MTREEFAPLKEFCDNNGYELLNTDHEDNEKFFVIAKKKDPWDGVEFARYVPTDTICKIKSKTETHIIPEIGVASFKTAFEPLTEEVYVERLKKEVGEKFGLIKEGDRFENVYGHKYSKPDFDLDGSYYRKDDDTFFIFGIAIYQAGKWAARLPKRIAVTMSGFHHDDYKTHECLQVELFIHHSKGFDPKSKAIFLASQLEKFLNGEIK